MSTNRILRWLTIAMSAVVIYGVGNFFQPTVVVGESMAPTLRGGRVIWIDRTYYKNRLPRRGEVVVFRLDGETFIKRVYRGPGEKLHYLGTGDGWRQPVRAAAVEKIRARYQARNWAVRMRKMRVPMDYAFVVGDNAAHSEDSRDWGPIPVSSIIGRAHLDVDVTPLLGSELTSPNGRHAGVPSSAHGA